MGEFFGLLFVALCIGMCVSKCFVEPHKNKVERDNEKLVKTAWLQNNYVSTSIRYVFNNTSNTVSAEYLVDKDKQNIVVADTSNHYTIIPFSKVIGCEILIDSQASGGVGRAIAGGILAGGVGAIVGATTEKKKISSYKVAIYRNNLNHPQFIFNLIKELTPPNSPDITQAVEFAQNVIASIKAIIAHSADYNKSANVIQPLNNINLHKQEKQEKIKELVFVLKKIVEIKTKDSHNTTKKDTYITEKDRIIKLNDLFNAGLITADEYNQKRAEILKML